LWPDTSDAFLDACRILEPSVHQAMSAQVGAGFHDVPSEVRGQKALVARIDDYTALNFDDHCGSPTEVATTTRAGH
jgi:hypothetical protein